MGHNFEQAYFTINLAYRKTTSCSALINSQVFITKIEQYFEQNRISYQNYSVVKQE